MYWAFLEDRRQTARLTGLIDAVVEAFDDGQLFLGTSG
jgi:hypothetical protein